MKKIEKYGKFSVMNNNTTEGIHENTVKHLTGRINSGNDNGRESYLSIERRNDNEFRVFGTHEKYTSHNIIPGNYYSGTVFSNVPTEEKDIKLMFIFTGEELLDFLKFAEIKINPKDYFLRDKKNRIPLLCEITEEESLAYYCISYHLQGLKTGEKYQPCNKFSMIDGKQFCKYNNTSEFYMTWCYNMPG
jgi:hypothetical protein